MAKIERSKQHTRDFEIALKAFRDTNPYGFRIDDDLQTGDKIHRIAIRSQTPDSLSLIVGDAVHNLRSALDHLVWQLVEANGQKPTDRTMFPISKDAATYKTAKIRKIQGISAAAENLIDTIKPYNGGTTIFGNSMRLTISTNIASCL